MKQIILCVETTKKAKTDCAYIDKVIKYFYKVSNIKISYVFMGGKSNYNSKGVETEIINKKRIVKDTVVVYIVDTDSINTSNDNKKLTENIEKYCVQNGYDLVWFYENIEEVFLHNRVDNTKKLEEAKRFGSSQGIGKATKESLSVKTKTRYKSNILLVLDKYLPRI